MLESAYVIRLNVRPRNDLEISRPEAARDTSTPAEHIECNWPLSPHVTHCMQALSSAQGDYIRVSFAPQPIVKVFDCSQS